MKKISAIDLFCGAGGLTHGLIKADVNVVAGFDIENSCKHAYEKNNPGAKFYAEDVSLLDSDFISSLYPEGHIRLLAGCAPCQPFSTYSQGRDVRSDKKWPLLYSFASLIESIHPELVTMENVPDVTKHEVYHDFEKKLRKLGYIVWAERVYCPDFGMPQERKRHVLLASRIGEIELKKPEPNPDYPKTVADTIKKLPPLSAGEQHSEDPLHICASLSPLNLMRIKASKPGGSWKDWPTELVAECHKKESGKTYSGVYARMMWDKPSPTMTTQCYGYGNGRFGHPEQDRAISLREAAMLQTFPQSYEFTPPDQKIQISTIGKMIGNAVPVALGKVIGETFIEHLQVHSGATTDAIRSVS
ncbi:DNA cytosine methyltransferase [Thalassospira alkalitolerans]|uniref:DNA cytosine methyltransferase n=1 Tax=Thalassospira alkalitolerans TaxID=1293890 RepID=UPI000A1ECE5B|nr:DNA cytosine methyltransferase [Thalassospira alkalitolerans]